MRAGRKGRNGSRKIKGRKSPEGMRERGGVWAESGEASRALPPY